MSTSPWKRVVYRCIAACIVLATGTSFAEDAPPPATITIESKQSDKDVAAALGASDARYVLVKTIADAQRVRPIAEPKKKLVLLNRSSDPTNALLALQRAVPMLSSVRIYHDFPRNTDDAEKIHGVVAVRLSGVTNASLVEGRKQAITAFDPKHSKAAGVIDLTTVTIGQGGSPSIATEVAARLKAQATTDVALLMAHISNGSAIFHDGSGLRLSTVRIPGQLWVVGCKSAQCLKSVETPVLGTMRKITYGQAVNLTRQLANATGSCEQLLVEQRFSDVFLLMQRGTNPLAAFIGIVGTVLVLDFAGTLTSDDLDGS